MKSTILFFIGLIILALSCNNTPSDSNENTDTSVVYNDSLNKDSTPVVAADTIVETTGIDTSEFNKKMKWMANGDSSGRWPVKAPYPVEGALLPFKRIVAYYGNLYSKGMGILGELPKKKCCVN
ncbi:hypothetical protein [Niabella ginsengisoli]|uniref:Uncharacterized protein n=1 Tax=Niabella ginsengisoli TaxID=522298 RepID=A0ABS9SER9_9BACT|nr:hypothetical protein [Niabella ginsengisoli]MCH5596853.1 hypothetical protein [Niabella ginsengisoli]